MTGADLIEWHEVESDRSSVPGAGGIRRRGSNLPDRLPKPRPLKDPRRARELRLKAAVPLVAVAHDVHAFLVDLPGEVAHLRVHERPRGNLEDVQEPRDALRPLQVVRDDVVPAPALALVLDHEPTGFPGRRVRRVAGLRADPERAVGVLEGDLRHEHRLLGLERQEVGGGRRWHPVPGHVRGKAAPDQPRDVDHPRPRRLDEVGEQLAVVAVEPQALEPRVEQRRLVLPRRGQHLGAQDDVRQVDVADVVPDPGVRELDAPLVGQVPPHLVPDLLAALVREVRQVLPHDLVELDVEGAARRRDVPRGGVARAHVQDHVHVLHRERPAAVEQLLEAGGAGEEGVVLEEVHLRALGRAEVGGGAHRQEVEAEVVVDAVPRAAGRGAHVQVLVVAVGDVDPGVPDLVDLGGGDGVPGVGLEGAVQLAHELMVHGVGVVVHEHGVLGPDVGLRLQEANDWGVAPADLHDGDVVEQLRTELLDRDVATAPDVGVRVDEPHVRRVQVCQPLDDVLALTAGVLDGDNKGHLVNQLLVSARRICWRHHLGHVGEGHVADEALNDRVEADCKDGHENRADHPMFHQPHGVCRAGALLCIEHGKGGMRRRGIDRSHANIPTGS